MTKKVIPKALINKALDMERSYWDSESNEPSYNEIIAWYERIEAETGLYWSAFLSICSAIFMHRGLNPDATNEDIYTILRLLGWEVSD